MTADIFLLGLAVAILMVIEARRVGVKFVWAYIIGAFAIAISAVFPLFLIARELRLEKSDATLLRPVDTILLALVAIVTLAITIWVEVL